MVVIKVDTYFCTQKNKIVKQTYMENTKTNLAFGRICKECDNTCTYDCEYKRNQDV